MRKRTVLFLGTALIKNYVLLHPTMVLNGFSYNMLMPVVQMYPLKYDIRLLTILQNTVWNLFEWAIDIDYGWPRVKKEESESSCKIKESRVS